MRHIHLLGDFKAIGEFLYKLRQFRQSQSIIYNIHHEEIYFVAKQFKPLPSFKDQVPHAIIFFPANDAKSNEIYTNEMKQIDAENIFQYDKGLDSPLIFICETVLKHLKEEKVCQYQRQSSQPTERKNSLTESLKNGLAHFSRQKSEPAVTEKLERTKSLGR